MIALPEDSKETSEGKDPYQVTAVLKFEKNDKPGKPEEEEETKIHVLKVWKQDQEEERPESIVVELLQTDVEGNTTVVDRQTLTKVLYLEKSFCTDALECVRGRGAEGVYCCCYA